MLGVRLPLLLLLLHFHFLFAADNGRAKVPPMGWNSWYALGCENLNETAVQETAAIMSSEWNGNPSLLSFGYQYLVLDDCWAAYQRDRQGNLVADPEQFPSGMKSLSEDVRALNLQMGLYTTPGNITCEGRAATGGHEQQDVQQFVVNWGMRYIKYCMCNTTHEWRLAAYGVFYDAVNATGIPVTIENDPPEHPWTWLAPDANLWGIYDIDDEFTAWVLRVNELQDRNEAPYAGPGHWNMPDMLQIGNGGQSLEEYRSQMSMYSLLSAPLFIGTDLRRLSMDTYELLTNQLVINVNQDPLGVQGQRMSMSGDPGQVWSKPMANGSFVIVFLNTDPSNTTQLEVTWASLVSFWSGFQFEYGDSYSSSDAIRSYYKDILHVEDEDADISVVDLWSGTSYIVKQSEIIESASLLPHHSQMLQLSVLNNVDTDSESSSSDNYVWIIVGLSIGGVLLFALLLQSALFVMKKLRKHNHREDISDVIESAA